MGAARPFVRGSRVSDQSSSHPFPAFSPGWSIAPSGIVTQLSQQRKLSGYFRQLPWRTPGWLDSGRRCTRLRRRGTGGPIPAIRNREAWKRSAVNGFNGYPGERKGLRRNRRITFRCRRRSELLWGEGQESGTRWLTLPAVLFRCAIWRPKEQFRVACVTSAATGFTTFEHRPQRHVRVPKPATGPGNSAVVCVVLSKYRGRASAPGDRCG